MPEDDIECEWIIVISIDSLLVYENKVYLENCTYRIVDNQITDCFDRNAFKD